MSKKEPAFPHRTAVKTQVGLLNPMIKGLKLATIYDRLARIMFNMPVTRKDVLTGWVAFPCGDCGGTGTFEIEDTPALRFCCNVCKGSGKRYAML